jgi:predicted secreted protein
VAAIAALKSRSIMPFSIPLAAAIFLTIWFTVLFAVLPFGVRSQHETGEVVPGSDPGAPVAPRLLAKALWTTLISAAIFSALTAFAAYTG